MTCLSAMFSDLFFAFDMGFFPVKAVGDAPLDMYQ